MSTRVFVAGATGVLGRRAVPALVAAGHDVTANVRNDAARRRAEEVGAAARTVDLFDREATRELAGEYDAIVNIATSIPTGVSNARPSNWAMNDRLRTEGARNLAAAMASVRGRYIGESITFPYTDGGDAWIGEAHPMTYFSGNASTRDAERAAASVTDAGGVGVALRFAMFYADDSAHNDMFRAMARRGIFGLTGHPAARVSFVHVDDAAAAVVAALDAPAGCYNVAEPDPARRSDHAHRLAAAVGRQRVRSVPKSFVKLGGAALDSVSRSHRISSASLSAATGWTPTIHVVDRWS